MRPVLHLAIGLYFYFLQGGNIFTSLGWLDLMITRLLKKLLINGHAKFLDALGQGIIDF